MDEEIEITEELELPNWRNPRYNAHGTIDIEIEHPTLGWIHFTADPNDSEPLGQELYHAAIELGGIAPVSLEAIKAAIVVSVQASLDTFARTRGYDSMLSACTYAASAVPQFAEEGQFCISVRDQTWSALYKLLSDVENGTRSIPSGYADIEPELPKLRWPAS